MHSLHTHRSKTSLKLIDYLPKSDNTAKNFCKLKYFSHSSLSWAFMKTKGLCLVSPFVLKASGTLNFVHISL